MATRIAFLLLILAAAAGVPAQTAPYLNDRGPGVATSMFGTYVRGGELLVYPFFEGYRDADYEYAPEEFGYEGNQDLRGSYRAQEQLLFVAYGFTEDVAVELEVAAIQATFEKSPLDTSSMPARIEESGLGDIEGQLRWRWRRETVETPEFFSYFEAVLPHDQEKTLIGTPEWEVKAGTGATRGFRWGTLTARAALEYAESEIALGEYAVEYLKRFSPHWVAFLAVEGSQVDEVSLITELQWHVRPSVVVKLNAGVGLTSKATDWAPEVGVLFRFPTRRLKTGS